MKSLSNTGSMTWLNLRAFWITAGQSGDGSMYLIIEPGYRWETSQRITNPGHGFDLMDGTNYR
jgi:hypothetical protein